LPGMTIFNRAGTGSASSTRPAAQPKRQLLHPHLFRQRARGGPILQLKIAMVGALVRSPIIILSSSTCACARLPPSRRGECARSYLDGRGRPFGWRFHRRSGTADVPCARERASTLRRYRRSVPWLRTRVRYHPALVFGFDAAGGEPNRKLPSSIHAVGAPKVPKGTIYGRFGVGPAQARRPSR
jgi:hypothetical protein